MKRSIHFLKMSGIIMSVSLSLFSCRSVGHEKFARQDDRYKNSFELLMLSEIHHEAANGNLIFQTYNRKDCDNQLWFYKKASGKMGAIPFAVCNGDFSISRNGRFAAYMDARYEIDGQRVRDGLLVYDIENECLVERISIGDNCCAFKFVGDILLYTIDGGRYLYDPLKKSKDVSWPFLDFCLNRENPSDYDIQKFYMTDAFDISDNGDIFVIAGSVESEGRGQVLVYKKGTDGAISCDDIHVPVPYMAASLELNPSASKIGISYFDTDSVTVIDIPDNTVEIFSVPAPDGRINWENDSAFQVAYRDCRVFLYRR